MIINSQGLIRMADCILRRYAIQHFSGNTQIKEDALHGIAKIWRNNEPFPKRTS